MKRFRPSNVSMDGCYVMFENISGNVILCHHAGMKRRFFFFLFKSVQ